MKLTSHSTSSRFPWAVPRLWAGLLLVAITTSGCAGWAANQLGPESMRQRFDSLRDKRAVEMDDRLSNARVPVSNPFTTSEPREAE